MINEVENNMIHVALIVILAWIAFKVLTKLVRAIYDIFNNPR